MRQARYDDLGNLDEVVADDVSSFHLEQLHTGTWWIGITHHDGEETTITLSTRRPSVTKISGICDMPDAD